PLPRAAPPGLPRGPLRPAVRSLLQAVVADPRLGLQAHPRAHPDGGGQQRERVRSPADPDQQARRGAADGRLVGEQLEPSGQCGAHGSACAGDGARRSGHQSTCTISAATASTAARAASASAPSKPCTAIEYPTVRPSGSPAPPPSVAAPPRYPVLPRTPPAASSGPASSKRSARVPDSPATGTAKRICSRAGASPEATWARTADSRAGGTRFSRERPEPSWISSESTASAGTPSSSASSRISASTAAAAPAGVVSPPGEGASSSAVVLSEISRVCCTSSASVSERTCAVGASSGAEASASSPVTVSPASSSSSAKRSAASRAGAADLGPYCSPSSHPSSSAREA